MAEPRMVATRIALRWLTGASYEPGGDDFLSGALIEASLMSRRLDREAPRRGAPHVFNGDYVGEHWVSTFALLALTDQPSG